jgi:hypothetical protein
MKQIKLWRIDSGGVIKIEQKPLDYENRLKKWLIEDISILNSNLTVIGREVETFINIFLYARNWNRYRYWV